MFGGILLLGSLATCSQFLSFSTIFWATFVANQKCCYSFYLLVAPLRKVVMVQFCSGLFGYQSPLGEFSQLQVSHF